MHAPLWESDPHWAAAVAAARRQGGTDIRLIAPRDLAPCFPALTPYEFAPSVWEQGGVEAVLAHKGLLHELPLDVVKDLGEGDWRPVFADEVFVLFTRGRRGARVDGPHVQAFHVGLACLEEEEDERRDLAGRLRRGCHLLVWDDQDAREEDRAFWAAWGRPATFTAGGRTGLGRAVRTWLATPGPEWLSVVHARARARPDFLEALYHFQDPRWRPWIDGASPLPGGGVILDGYAIHHRRRGGLVHIHGHRRVWKEAAAGPAWTFGPRLSWSWLRHGVWAVPGLVAPPRAQLARRAHSPSNSRAAASSTPG